MKGAPSIHTRLLLGLVIPLIFVAALIAFETYLQSRKISNELYDQTLLSVMLVISENVIETEGDLLSENILEALTENLGDQFFYHVAGPDNAFVTGYTGVPEYRGERVGSPTEPLFYDGIYQGDPVRVVTVSQLVSEQEINGWMTITAWQRVSQRQQLALGLLTSSIVRVLAIVVSAGIIVWVALSYGLRPLEILQRSIEKRSPDDLTPIRHDPPAEVRGMVTAMNRLFGQVAKANRVRERFIGDAAHQLRNPIAAIKTQSEAALLSENPDEYRQSVQKILRTTNDTGRLVEQLLTGARAHAQDPDDAETFALNEIVRGAAESGAMAALQNGHEFVYEAGEREYFVRGYPILFGEAIANLIDNAIRHTPDGTWIKVGLENGSADQATVYVADEGQPFSDEELNQLIQPFATGDSETQGSGLGLAVVDDIARMHGGQLAVTPGRGGQGKEMRITLPVSSG